MARVYSDDFHDLVDLYGELLDQIESTMENVEIATEEMSSRFEDLHNEMDEAWSMLRKLERNALPILLRAEKSKSVIKEQCETDLGSFIFEMPEEELPFCDI